MHVHLYWNPILSWDSQISTITGCVTMNMETCCLVTYDPLSLKNNRLKFKSSKNVEKFKQIYSNLIKKTERCQHVTGWTWKH